ncbi:MAG TPA: AMP-binding protein [Trebonia sp.]|nr:AMP-binding protein [Trebonia sp.]
MLRDWIDQAAASHGDDVYLADARGTATLTYAELSETARDTELRLEKAGLMPGSRIGVRLTDPLEYAAALVAIVAAGRVAVPLDPGAPEADLARVLAVARPDATVTVDAGSVDTGRPGGQAPRSVTGEAKRSFGPVLFDFDLEGRALGGPGAPPAAAVGGIFLSTSGTTGTPKGILLREEQLMHVAASVVAAHRLTRADRGYCSLPLFHVNAEVVGVLATLRAGAYLALDRKFSRRGFWEIIGDRQITWINAVPAIISILSMDPPAARPAALRFVRSASAPLPLASLRKFEDAVGVPVVETYGMTEAASMITANPVDGPRKPGSAGRPAGSQVRVEAADDPVSGGPVSGGPVSDGRDAAPGEIGRVKIRGAGVITAYDSGGKPGVIDADGWLDTGDLGYLDTDGYLFLVGRSDDVINRGGEKIYPRDIEEILLAQPGVRSAAIIGIPDAVLGERPVAYITPADGAPGTEVLAAALRAVCAERLPRYKQPAEFRFMDQLPLGPTGKISRRLLKDQVTARP